MEDVVDLAGFLLQGLGQLGRDAGRGDLLHLTVVLGVVVEELVGGDHLGDGEHYRLLARLVAAYGHLGAFEVALYHDLVALHEGVAQGRGELVGILHLGDAEAGTVGGRLHEAGHAHDGLDFLFGVFVFLAATEQDAVGHVDVEGAHEVVEHVFVERHGLHKHTTGGVGNVEQLEIALQDAVLARRAVNGDVGIVEDYGFPVVQEREVVFVDGHDVAVIEVDVPVEFLHVDNVDIVSLFVEKAVEPLGRAQRHVVL